MTDEPDDEDEPSRDDDHLATVDPGAGCTEIWEHLSEYRTDAETDEE